MPNSSSPVDRLKKPGLPAETSSNSPEDEAAFSAQVKAKKEAEKKLAIAARIELERRTEVESILKAHGKIEQQIAAIVEPIISASQSLERLQQMLGRSRLARETSLGRRLRVSESVRTVNTARQQLSRLQKVSAYVGQALKDDVDEIVRPNSESAFE